jgi:AAA domain
MKIIRFSAENIKRLKVVEITPDGTLQIITGKNAAGKTSVLDAIWLALGGRAASRGTVRPIRDGEDHASVTLDLGDLVVTRTWAGDTSTLTVKTAEGAKYSSPQTVLDALVGRLSFDPLEFTRLSGREQVTALLDLVDLDVDLGELAGQRQAAYDERTEIGRQVRALGEIPKPTPAPDVEVSATDLIAQIRAGEALLNQYDSDCRAWQAAREQVADRRAEILALTETLHDWERKMDERAKIIEAPTITPDIEALEAQLDVLEATNRAVRQNNAIARATEEKAALDAQYLDLSYRIATIDAQKADALAAAAFPVPGLGFDDDGVTYQGVPFSQASSAEQIRVSLAMAMALNPKLRVIRIMDGSLLDAESMALIAEMAAAADFQCWVERIEDDNEAAVVIEDGSVA